MSQSPVTLETTAESTAESPSPDTLLSKDELATLVGLSDKMYSANQGFKEGVVSIVVLKAKQTTNKDYPNILKNVLNELREGIMQSLVSKNNIKAVFHQNVIKNKSNEDTTKVNSAQRYFSRLVEFNTEKLLKDVTKKLKEEAGSVPISSNGNQTGGIETSTVPSSSSSSSHAVNNQRMNRLYESSDDEKEEDKSMWYHDEEDEEDEDDDNQSNPEGKAKNATSGTTTKRDDIFYNYLIYWGPSTVTMKYGMSHQKYEGLLRPGRRFNGVPKQFEVLTTRTINVRRANKQCNIFILFYCTIIMKH
jgi:hypothetical protein